MSLLLRLFLENAPPPDLPIQNRSGRHTRASAVRFTSLALLCVAAACYSPAHVDKVKATPPALVRVDSFALQETDSLFIGKIMGFTIDTSGNIYVADAFARHVVSFARDGKPLRVYGRPGVGRGEFQMPFLIAPIGDSLLAVAVCNPQAIQILGRRSGVYYHAGRY
jgi:hypothetical protein